MPDWLTDMGVQSNYSYASDEGGFHGGHNDRGGDVTNVSISSFMSSNNNWYRFSFRTLQGAAQPYSGGLYDEIWC